MIPTMILVGLVLGLLRRPWYVVGAVVASLGWTVALVVTDVIAAGDIVNVLGAVFLALLNVFAGVGVTKGVIAAIRSVGQPSKGSENGVQ